MILSQGFEGVLLPFSTLFLRNCIHHFGMVGGSKYCNTHEPQRPLSWRRGQLSHIQNILLLQLLTKPGTMFAEY